MTALTTFHLSKILGTRIYSSQDEFIGIVQDLLIDNNPDAVKPGEPYRPRIVAVKSGTKAKPVYYDFQYFTIQSSDGKYSIICSKKKLLEEFVIKDYVPLKESILDKQIVDLNGKKLVRVNDIRLATVTGGTFVVAVDVGMEGLLRRLGISKTSKTISSMLGFKIPSKFILWDDVDTLDMATLNIRLGKVSSKLRTLHPSDLADIIEELSYNSRTAVFSNLDEEQAADVLEEMEPKTQVDLIESLSVAKAADVLEKMPVDEAADIIDLLEDEKAEILLREMDAETSEEVRELLEYSDKSVGSIMNTDFISFHENETVAQALSTIREAKPEEPELYSIFIVNHGGKLIATVTLRDLILSDPDVVLSDIMRRNPVAVLDEDKLDSLAEIVSKYNMLAIPVVNSKNLLEGMVVIDDIIDDLLGERKTR